MRVLDVKEGGVESGAAEGNYRGEKLQNLQKILVTAAETLVELGNLRVGFVGTASDGAPASTRICADDRGHNGVE